ncbi:ribonuclease III domain-containing protein [Penicillium brevicompactum]|uniref:ribonuclease III domain-containing protein n=1 Tax=Penicillium brevicompactum TaxID=5074 RepID=UPI0025402F42|nr:ribonuclease III domain-containing protein [Penicillium brevicompactum]KAJ5346996.1 ribonuclease III domain-containing protein [Penicillium brevicompactum]
MFHPASLDDQKIVTAENSISYRFTDRLELRQALQLADSIHQDGNKNLALLGDTVIRLVFVQEGLCRGAPRGQINNTISQKSSNVYLAQRGFSAGLAECVYKNQSQGNTIYPGPMATTVEAIVGAVFKDSGEKITAAKGTMEALGISWHE